MNPQVLAMLALSLLTAPRPSSADSAAPAARTEPYSWRNVAIVGSGFVPGLVFHPSERGLLYARTDIGGAYRWDSAGARWIPLLDWVSAADWNLLGVESIGLDPSNPQKLYLALGTYTNGWASNGAMLISDNQGRSFRRVDLPFKLGGNEDGRSMGERLAVDPNAGRVLFFGSRRDGLWKSADAGLSWRKIESFPSTENTKDIGIGWLLFDASSGRRGQPTPIIYAAMADARGGIVRSRDGGATWESIAGQPTGLLSHHGALDGRGNLFVTYGDAPGPNGMSRGAVWKLETGPGAWSDITPLQPGSREADGQDAGSFGYAGLALDAKNPGTILVSTMDRWSRGDDIFRSTDGGRTWRGLKARSTRDSSASPFLNWGRQEPEFGHWIGDVEIDPFDSSRALYVTGATIWGTDNLGDFDGADSQAGPRVRWDVRARGLEETAVLDLISPPQGAHLLSGLGDVGGFRHDDLEASPRGGMFQNPSFNNTISLDFAELKPSFIARTGTSGRGQKHIAFSNDGGATWQPAASEPESAANSDERPRSVALAADASACVWVAGDGVAYWTPSSGASWRPCIGLPPGLSVIADRLSPRAFYAADGKGKRLFASDDGGASFAERAALPGGGKLRAVPGSAGELWLASGNGLHHSTNGGARWESVAGVEADAVGFGKAAAGRYSPAIYITGRVRGVSGVFRSDDVGANWVRINDDAHRYGWIGAVITGDPRVYGRVYFGTNGRGIIRGERGMAR